MHRLRNGLRTAILLGGLTALFIAAGAALGGSRGVVIAFGLSVLMNAGTYFWSDKLALRAMGARPVSEAEAPWLYEMVRELVGNRPMPRIYVSPARQPNAFATGRNPKHAAICVTEGILQILDPRELRAVLAHELSHVYNRDILIAGIAATLAGALTALAHLAYLLPFGSSDDDDGGSPLAALLMLIVGPLAAGLIQLAISRSREFQADASGAELAGDPIALARALEKIERGVQAAPLPPDPSLTPRAHLMIANPFAGGGLASLFRTHPPTAERIRRLQQLAAGR
ncbi:MAG TPA: M48 family metalloprotease [Kribbella sp.]